MTSPSRWDDLAPRLASAAVLLVVGLGGIVAGDPWVSGLFAMAAGLMTWEVARMTAPARPREAVLIGLLAFATMVFVLAKHNPFALAWMPLPALIGVLRPRSDRFGFLVTSLAIMFACYALVAFRLGLGLEFVLWLVLTIIATDTLGYFGGKIIGGPKFWPAISPKKTWAGTISGWLGATLVGVVFWVFHEAPGWIVPFSPLVAFASQLGDIGESAIKRRAGVKDASRLIPGHGGLMDRLDALSGAAIFLLVWGMIWPLPYIGAAN